MDSSFLFDTINLGWSIVYIEGPQVIIFKMCITFSEDCFCQIANSVDPDEMLPHATFHLGLHFLQKYQFMGFQIYKLKG